MRTSVSKEVTIKIRPSLEFVIEFLIFRYILLFLSFIFVISTVVDLTVAVLAHAQIYVNIKKRLILLYFPYMLYYIQACLY